MTGSVQDLIARHDEELLNHPDVRAAISELKELIQQGHPEADFYVEIGYDPLGIYLDAYVDVEDTDEVRNLYRERMLDLQVEDRIPIHVSVYTSPERWAEDDLAPEPVATRATG